jgi:outer membrane lipoprotein-sorting protein
MLFAAILLAPQTDASDLYDKMVKAVAEAPSLSCAFKSELKADPLVATLDGSFKLKSGNRLRVELSSSAGGRRKTGALVCDGSRVAETVDGAARDPEEAQADLAPRFARGVAAVGAGPFHAAASQAKFDRKRRNELPALEIALEGLEAKGEEEGRKVIVYTATIAGVGAFRVKAWLDPATFLPAKRVVEFTLDAAAVVATETAEFSTTELKDEEFKLPEKK